MSKESEKYELTTLSTQELTKLLEKRFEDRDREGLSVRGGSEVVRLLSRMSTGSKRGVIDVQLEVPKAISKGLKSKTLVRSGGVVRRASGKQIAKHLKEIKPAKAQKLKNAALLPLLVLDAAERALVDQKLIKIQKVLEGVDRKLDAQIEGQLVTALKLMRDAGRLQDPMARARKLHDAQNEFRRAESHYEHLYRSMWGNDYAPIKDSYLRAKLQNTSQRTKLVNLSRDLVDQLQIVLACKQTHLQISSELGEFEAAEQEAIELETFILEEEERFQKEFGPRSFLRQKNRMRSVVGRVLRTNPEYIRRSTRDQLQLPLEKIAFMRNVTICHHLALNSPKTSDEGAPSES